MRNIRLLLACLAVILILTCIASYGHTAESDPAYLVVMTMTNTGQNNFVFNYHEIPNMAECFDIVKNSNVNIPSGGDAEGAVTIYCAPTRAKAWEYGEMRE